VGLGIGVPLVAALTCFFAVRRWGFRLPFTVRSKKEWSKDEGSNVRRGLLSANRGN
jgi:hypothetical protein